jgi:hypothetical protein
MITTFAYLTIPQHYMCIYCHTLPLLAASTLIILFSKEKKFEKTILQITNIFEEKYGT